RWEMRYSGTFLFLSVCSSVGELGHRLIVDRGQHLSDTGGLALRLAIQAPAHPRGRGVNPTYIHNLAQRSMIGCDPPLIECESISLFEILGPRNVLAGKVYPADGDEGRQLLRPLHGRVVHRHRGQIGTQLYLQSEVKGMRPQLLHQGRTEYLRSALEVEMVVNDLLDA